MEASSTAQTMSKPNKRPVVMTIAGLDPSGGAGVLGDIKTISALGCYAVAVVTSLTFQNTQNILGARHETAETVRQQMSPLFDDFEIAAIKTGMLPTAEIIHEVARVIRSKAVPILVVDPVLRSTSGFDLIDDPGLEALTSHLFPLASLVTPNLAEAERLTCIQIPDHAAALRAAEAIRSMGPGAVLITGGDVDDELATDLLLDEQGSTVYSARRIRSEHTHGTGCALASALACLLSRGGSLRDSIPVAKQYISEAILNAPRLGRGNGPLNHFPQRFENE